LKHKEGLGVLNRLPKISQWPLDLYFSWTRLQSSDTNLGIPARRDPKEHYHYNQQWSEDRGSWTIWVVPGSRHWSSFISILL